jgi:SAM-dependent methyltransferase
MEWQSCIFRGELVVGMHQGWFAQSAAVGLLLVAAALPVAAKTRAECEADYTPQRAQEGKDVIWAPTEDSMVVPMLEMAKVTRADKVYDLGSGDGKIPIAAAKRFGATAVGIEYDGDLVMHARCLAEAEGVQSRVTFVEGDIFATDFSHATVVTLYLTPPVNLRLLSTLLAMKPGTRVVSYSFGIGDWEPDDQIDSFGDGSAFLWIVPVNVHGTWTFHAGSGESFEVELEQTYQNLRGTARGAAVTGKLVGDRVELAFTEGGGPVRVAGIVGGGRIAATVSRGATTAEHVGTRNR